MKVLFLFGILSVLAVSQLAVAYPNYAHSLNTEELPDAPSARRRYINLEGSDSTIPNNLRMNDDSAIIHAYRSMARRGSQYPIHYGRSTDQYGPIPANDQPRQLDLFFIG